MNIPGEERAGQDSDLRRQVIDRLAHGTPPDDLILAISASRNRSWQQAEALVNEIRQASHPEIQNQRAPLLIATAMLIFAGGLGLIIYSICSLISSMNMFVQFRDLNWLELLQFVFLGNMLVPGTLMQLFIGTGMLLGSFIGMRRVWSSLLFRDTED